MLFSRIKAFKSNKFRVKTETKIVSHSVMYYLNDPKKTHGNHGSNQGSNYDDPIKIVITGVDCL